MSDKPVISVIVACYNQSLYLMDALTSVRNQTLSDWECIIVNDGSTDETDSLAREACYHDKRFIYLPKPNGGVSSARNAGIKIARGKFILPLDSDDKIHPEYLSKAVNILEKETNVKLVYCKACKFGCVEEDWDLPEFNYHELLLGNNMIFAASIFRREDFISTGGYRTNMQSGWEDWDFWILFLNGVRPKDVVRINEVLFYYRIKDISRSVTFDTDTQIQESMIQQSIKNNIEIYLKYFPDLLGNLRNEKYQSHLLKKGIVWAGVRLYFFWKNLKKKAGFR